MLSPTAHRTSPPADLTLLGIFWDILDDIRQALTSNAPDAARLTAIAAALAEKLPGPPGGMPSLLPGDGERDPVAVLTRRLAGGEMFTAVAAEMAGQPISARVVRSKGTTGLNRAEAGWLDTGPDARALRRRGELRTADGGVLVARVTSCVIPGRVGDPGALAELEETDTPLGAVVARLGGWRENLWQWPYCGGDTILHTCARLWLPRSGCPGRWPAGLATEQVRDLNWWAASSR